MSVHTAQLAREMIVADRHIKDAVARQAFSEAQTWLDTRERLADERYVRLRDEIKERWQAREAA